MPDAPPSRAALGAAVRYIRERDGLTQEDLASEAGFHPTYVSAIERGLKDVRWSTVGRLAEGLAVTVVELVAIAERTELD